MILKPLNSLHKSDANILQFAALVPFISIKKYNRWNRFRLFYL